MSGSLRLRFNLENSVNSENISSEDERTTILTSRRAARKRNKPKKYGEYVEQSPTKCIQRQDHSSDESEPCDENMSLQKPTELFSNDDVEGQDMFKFKSRHTHLDLQNKVKDVIMNSPKTLDSPILKTPRKSLLSKVNESTPKHIKDVIKKRIIKEVESDSPDESDFSGSSSDFVPESSGKESGSSANEDSELENEKEKPNIKVELSKKKIKKMKAKDSDYIVTPDNYFMMHSSKKIQTSDHTLSRLKNLNIDENIHEDSHITDEHKSKIANLNKSYEHIFNRWLYVLSENFNLVLYGIGSKRSILHQFIVNKLHGYPCVVVNGFFPSLTIKSILETIVTDLLEISHVPSNIGDVVALIHSGLTEANINLFLIVHNIDGVMLRNSKAQSMLANLSQIPNVHTIATIDHINAPLLWDHAKLSKFRFTWWDATTFLPYTEETSYENSIMSHRSGALQISSLMSVYQSLTSNAKGIFKIIIKYQLENHKQPHYQGLPFKDLYSKSREQFLVSSDVALRAQLTEFLDHKLVKMKRTYEGSESLVIPIDNVLLQLQFLDEQNS